MVEQMLRHTAHLVQLRQRTGKYITLALEPEPACFIETIEESVAFFREHLFADGALGSRGAAMIGAPGLRSRATIGVGSTVIAVRPRA